MTPIADAIAKLDRRTPVGSTLRSAEWAEVPLALRDRAFFSATLTNAQVLSEAKRRLSDAVALRTETLPNGKQAFVDRSSFIGDLRKLVTDLGLSDGSGGLTDLASQRRLGLIFDQNTQEAYGYARAKAGQSDGALAAYPAQELIRIEDRQKPRDWRQRWVAAGGRLFGDRMVALKTDPVWAKLSRFGTPWAPFDFGSGMGLQDVDYDEAIALGLLQEGELPKASLPEYNAKLEASAQDLDPATVQQLQAQFGDTLLEHHGKLKWEGDRIGAFFSGSLDGTVPRDYRMSLGAPQPAVAAAAPAGTFTPKTKLIVQPDDLRHIIGQHGRSDVVPGRTGEQRGDQRPLEPHELAWIPHIWRQPDSVEVARDGGLILRKKLAGDFELIVAPKEPGSHAWKPASMRVKR